MKVRFTKDAVRQFNHLPKHLKRKAQKQLIFLAKNYRHSSLRTRKMSENVFEGRIDYHYRFSFMVDDETILLLSIGPHDTGLGKK